MQRTVFLAFWPIVLLTACGTTKESADTPEAGATDSGTSQDVPPTDADADADSGSTAIPNDHDGVKNGDETDVDCGGPSAKKCRAGLACVSTLDCDQVLCDTQKHVCADPSHADGIKNSDETGVDCGGPSAIPRCPAGQGCASNADCDVLKCDVGGSNLCLPASHGDGVKNDGETGIDCGGDALPAKCATGQGCAGDDDCDNVRCVGADGAKTCDEPRNNDGLTNGTETDVDCGGGSAPKCLFGQKCTVAADCNGGGCDINATCSIPSCDSAAGTVVDAAGIVSCGVGETGQPDAVHESCCKSLTEPGALGTTWRLDKYEITSGRFRKFLASAAPTGNLRQWVQDYATGHPGSQLANLASIAIDNGASTMLSIYPDTDGVNDYDAHNLTAHMVIDIDNYDGIRGCYNGDGDYAANTYWMDDAHEAVFGLSPRTMPRSYSDEKPLNCAMPIMFAAFCAWDGDGQLATLADFQSVWTATYPWGPNDLARPNYNWCNGPYQNDGFLCQCDGVHNAYGTAACPNPASQFQILVPTLGAAEAGVFYAWPRNTDRSKDNEPLIAAPGRMVNDGTSATGNGNSSAAVSTTAEKWMDLYANYAEYTGDFLAGTSDWCDFSVDGGGGGCTRAGHGTDRGVHHTKIPSAGIIGSSWGGHKYDRGKVGAFPATFQYGKFGGRCVRPTVKY